MKVGGCVRTNFGYVGCYVDVLDVLHGRCTGRRRCALDVVEPTFGNRRPCNVELNNYLEVDYICLPGSAVSVVDDSDDNNDANSTITVIAEAL